LDQDLLSLKHLNSEDQSKMVKCSSSLTQPTN